MEERGCLGDLIEIRRKLHVGKIYTIMRHAYDMSLSDREGVLAPFKAKCLVKEKNKVTFLVYVNGGTFKECYQYWDLWKGVLKNE